MRAEMSHGMPGASSSLARVKRRKLNLKAEVESIIYHFSFKRLVPGNSNLGLIGSTCTALPGSVSSVGIAVS